MMRLHKNQAVNLSTKRINITYIALFYLDVNNSFLFEPVISSL